MHPPWPVDDIVALTRMRGLTSADIIALVHTCGTIDEALDRIGRTIGLPLGLDDTDVPPVDTSADSTIVTYFCDAYPARLRAIPHPPIVLDVRGRLPPDDIPAIAVVGTRAATAQYGKPVTESLVRAWVEAGCCIVSGLANGIDTLAHEATIAMGGITVAVIACGIDRITPIHAKGLAERIVVGGGCIVSEYARGQAALPPYFPQRNRIISGLGDAVVIVESKRTGGALITAEFARQHHRPLYAVPGPITSLRSAGCNALLASGHARTLCDARQLLEDLGIDRLPGFGARPRPDLSGIERRLIDTIGNGMTYVDDIAREALLSVDTVLQMLLDLEFRGLVRRLPGQRFIVLEE